MKKIIFSLFIITTVTASNAQTKSQSSILDKFIAANNAGTPEAISKFIKETYDQSLLNKINLQEHIDFYTMISKDFGKLKSSVYQKIEENPQKLVVHLIKEKQNPLTVSINPAEVLVVEMDLNERNPKYLKKGLGLGALVCELKK